MSRYQSEVLGIITTSLQESKAYFLRIVSKCVVFVRLLQKRQIGIGIARYVPIDVGIVR
jgi:hypothetical protein